MVEALVGMKTGDLLLRLQDVVRARESYIFLAQQYLRAAEEFGSLALLDKAALYLRPAVAGGPGAGWSSPPPAWLSLELRRTAGFTMEP